jgi:hypothetical protein
VRWFFEPIPVAHTDNGPAAQAVQLEMQRAISGEQRILLPFEMSLFGNLPGRRVSGASIASGRKRASRENC